jgi:hypothetical protein
MTLNGAKKRLFIPEGIGIVGFDLEDIGLKGVFFGFFHWAASFEIFLGIQCIEF